MENQVEFYLQKFIRDLKPPLETLMEKVQRRIKRGLFSYFPIEFCLKFLNKGFTNGFDRLKLNLNYHDS